MTNCKTISAYVDQETIERIAQLAKLEYRSRSQIAAMAIKLGAVLPPEAWSDLLQINNWGFEADWQVIGQEIAQVLSDYHYRLIKNKMATQVDRQWLDSLSLETEDKVLDTAVKLTSNV